MKIYNENNELVTTYDRTQYRLKLEKVLIGSYASYVEIPQDYRGYQISIENGAYKVYERYGRLIAYTEQEILKLYEREVEKQIRQKYSVSQELALLRQRYVKIEEFDEYNSYVENCKTNAKILYKLI